MRTTLGGLAAATAGGGLEAAASDETVGGAGGGGGAGWLALVTIGRGPDATALWGDLGVDDLGASVIDTVVVGEGAG
jgi:hypothetical protein